MINRDGATELQPRRRPQNHLLFETIDPGFSAIANVVEALRRDQPHLHVAPFDIVKRGVQIERAIQQTHLAAQLISSTGCQGDKKTTRPRCPPSRWAHPPGSLWPPAHTRLDRSS